LLRSLHFSTRAKSQRDALRRPASVSIITVYKWLYYSISVIWAVELTRLLLLYNVLRSRRVANFRLQMLTPHDRKVYPRIRDICSPIVLGKQASELWNSRRLADSFSCMARVVPCKEVLGQILGASSFGDMSFTPRWKSKSDTVFSKQ
jgi:hypothetical protein